MKLSDKRRQAIFDAVYAEITNARIKVAKLIYVATDKGETVDDVLAQAGTRAGEAAIKAAEGATNGKD